MKGISFFVISAFINTVGNLPSGNHNPKIAHEKENITLRFENLAEDWTELKLVHNGIEIYETTKDHSKESYHPRLERDCNVHLSDDKRSFSLEIPLVKMNDSGEYMLKSNRHDQIIMNLIVRGHVLLNITFKESTLVCCLASEESRSYILLSEGMLDNTHRKMSLHRNFHETNFSSDGVCITYNVTPDEMIGAVTFYCIFQHEDKKEQPIIKASVYEFGNTSQDPKTTTMRTEVPPTNDHANDNCNCNSTKWFFLSLGMCLGLCLGLCLGQGASSVKWSSVYKQKKGQTNDNNTQHENIPLSNLTGTSSDIGNTSQRNENNIQGDDATAPLRSNNEECPTEGNTSRTN